MAVPCYNLQSLFWNPPYCEIFDRAIVQLKTCRKNFCNSARCSRVFLVFVHQNRSKLLLSEKIFKNTWKDLQRRRCSTSWAILPCSARPLGPSRRTNVDKCWQSLTKGNTRWEKGFPTLKLWKVTRIGLQPRISGPVVKRADWKKDAN